jgi:hypothetical protein
MKGKAKLHTVLVRVLGYRLLLSRDPGGVPLPGVRLRWLTDAQHNGPQLTAMGSIWYLKIQPVGFLRGDTFVSVTVIKDEQGGITSGFHWPWR